MTKVDLPPVLASACIVLAGSHGSITRHARQRGVSRQTLYREAAFVLTAIRGEAVRARLQQLEQTVGQLQQQVRHLQQQLAQAVLIDKDKQGWFAATAQAEGVSLPVAQRLLQIFLEARTPSVAQLGRYSRQAAVKAGAVLAVLDPPSRARVEQVSSDEMFVRRRPVLMGVEPDSLCWVIGHLTERRDGEQWAAEFRQLPQLQHVLRDAGTGMEKGLEAIDAERQKQGQKPVAQSLDHFHLTQEGSIALRRLQSQASRALEQAERADKEVTQQTRCGRNRAGFATKAKRLWDKAERAMESWRAEEQAWQRLCAGLKLYTAAGRLNDRETAEALVAEVLPQLQDPAWAKVRRYLSRPEVFTYLDRVHEQLAALPEEARQAAVRAEELQRQAEQHRGGVGAGFLLVVAVLRGLAEKATAGVVAAVQKILAQAYRGSSAVEGLNSVLRMQQCRHRRLTQELLDLKRLYWNCRPLRTGKRRNQTPYERLGLKLPVDNWWELLKMPPEQLKQQLSAPKDAA